MTHNNPYVNDFLQISDLGESEYNQLRFVINPDHKPNSDHSRVHNLNLQEVAVLTNEEPVSADIVVRRRDGGVSIVSDIHRSFDPLHFVLLFPFGTEGWHTKIKQRLLFLVVGCLKKSCR